MSVTLFLVAVVAVTQGSKTPPSDWEDLTVTQGSTTPPSNRESNVGGHPVSSLLYSALQATGFTDSCVSGELDHCSQIQEIRETKVELQKVQAQAQDGKEMVQQNMQEIKVELQKAKAEAQEGKEIVQQEIQEVKTELQEVKTEVQEGKVEVQEGKEMVQQEVQELKTELQQLKTELQNMKTEGKELMQQEIEETMQLISLVAHKLEALPRHCKDLLDLGDEESGIRQVYPYTGRPTRPVTVYCDQDVDGGGWTVFQRRVNSTNRVNFYRNFTEYQAGFGDVNGEFWLGLDTLYELTKEEQELRVDLHDYEGEHRWAKYGIFRVGSKDTSYILNIGMYSGDAGDAMDYNSGHQFSTHDNDNDKASTNCAEERLGGWWYNTCSWANLNGYQHVGHFNGSSVYEGIVWYQWRGSGYSLRRTAMMVRPAI